MLRAPRGVGAVEFNVFGDNARAIRLYQTCGYRVVTRVNLASVSLEPVTELAQAI
jgi:hypothetical protein